MQMIRRLIAFAVLAVGAPAGSGPLGGPFGGPLTAPPPVPREFRAVWATPIWDRGFQDFPSRTGMTPDEQRAEIRTMLDRSASLGLNTIIMHVRMAGDALYPTSFAPWSSFLSGTSGVG